MKEVILNVFVNLMLLFTMLLVIAGVIITAAVAVRAVCCYK